MDEATRNQTEAAHPARSTWLTANAGSGKTRVLTDRVARLLLNGTAPERILCLTYTKAAATEMQNRLLKRLGEWAMLPEADLKAALAQLGEEGAPDLAKARRLFARAIEAPGGLKVQTIHSFCAALLRRFPIEAGVPMGFAELDDRSARALRADIIEEMAQEQHPVIRDLTELHGGDDLERFLAGLSATDFEAPADQAAIWSALGLPPGLDEAALLGRVFTGGEGDLIGALLPVLATGTDNDLKLAGKLTGADWQTPGLAELGVLADALLTGPKAKEPYTAKIGSIPTKKLQNGAAAQLMDDLNDLMLRVQDARPLLAGLSLALKSLSLHRFAHEFTRRLSTRKLAHGWLDFDDLILCTVRLLRESSVAQWVLWRLDGGIDHILVDEAQDTSPEQWSVIRSLTHEFTSGAGASNENRTLFVVGDPKQSIYSFQGADIKVFESMRDKFAADFQAIHSPMQQRGLSHSFRSSPAILKMVDAVFQGEAAEGLGEPPRHVAFRAGLPGRVDIWPAIPQPEKPEAGDWTDPVDTPARNSETAVLARAIARQIGQMIGTPFFDAKAERVRAIGPGDIQILVQRRQNLFNELIRECKAQDLPVAGADRLKLATELAVRDITATLSVLTTPEDDLSLAAALRSPLFGLSEDDLYRLSAGRGRISLWQRLNGSSHQGALAILHDLARVADFIRPYDLISRLLNRHEGRTRLLARLGGEAEDGITELLSQALAYEQFEPPSLTGFLVWLAGDDVEVKRQLPSGEGGLIRIMTVHGSKGLESPVVILPETRKRGNNNQAKTIGVGGIQAWRGAASDRPEPVNVEVDALRKRQEEEQRRLLYVAMTRAESWLIVAAAGNTGEGLESWHSLICDGAGRAELDRCDLEIEGVGIALRLSFGEWPQTEQASPASESDDGLMTLPDWARRPAPRVQPQSRPVAATSLGGAKVLGGGGENADPVAAMLRGTRLHLLLEYLPGSLREDRASLARAVLAGAEGGLPGKDEFEALLSEAQTVIDAPDLSEVMQPPADANILSEVQLTAKLPGIGVLHGTIDRLIVQPHEVLAIDYKSNSAIPTRPEQTPLGLLRQMAAYRAALRGIYPDRSIRSAILWTTAPSLMELPDSVLDHAMSTLDPSAPGS